MSIKHTPYFIVCFMLGLSLVFIVVQRKEAAKQIAMLRDTASSTIQKATFVEGTFVRFDPERSVIYFMSSGWSGNAAERSFMIDTNTIFSEQRLSLKDGLIIGVEEKALLPSSIVEGAYIRARLQGSSAVAIRVVVGTLPEETREAISF